MSANSTREEFAGFLERLVASKGNTGALDWHKYVVNHHADEEIEQMRRTVARLGISWTGRDWPDFNCELVLGWAKRLRQSIKA